MRYLASEAASTTPAEAGSPAPAEEASASPNSLGTPTGMASTLHVAGQLRLAAKVKALCPVGTARLPAWWSDTNVNAYGAYRIIQNRFKRHGSQSEFVCVRLQHPLILQVTIGVGAGEENYRQLISRVKSRQDAFLALKTLDQGRKARAVLQQHVPFTFHTSQAFIKVCILLFFTAGTQQQPVGQHYTLVYLWIQIAASPCH